MKIRRLAEVLKQQRAEEGLRPPMQKANLRGLQFNRNEEIMFDNIDQMARFECHIENRLEVACEKDNRWR